MEERNALLKKNLDLLYQSTLAGVVCILLMIIPLVNIIALVVALIAAIMVFVAMYRLRELHDDYHTAFMLSIINIALELIGGMMGGNMESIVGLISTAVSFAQTYHIIRATNSFLAQLGRDEVIQRGQATIKMYKINLVISVVASVLLMIAGNSTGRLMVALLAIVAVVSLVVSIMAIVRYLKYLGAARECF